MTAHTNDDDRRWIDEDVVDDLDNARDFDVDGVRRKQGAHAWTMDRRARKNVSLCFIDFYAFGFVKRARRSRAGRRLAFDRKPTVRARSRTSSQTSSLGPPPRGKRVAPVPPGRRRPTTEIAVAARARPRRRPRVGYFSRRALGADDTFPSPPSALLRLIKSSPQSFHSSRLCVTQEESLGLYHFHNQGCATSGRLSSGTNTEDRTLTQESGDVRSVEGEVCGAVLVDE